MDGFVGADPADRALLTTLYTLVERQDRAARKITRDFFRGLMDSNQMGEPGELVGHRIPDPHEPAYMARYMASMVTTTCAWRFGQKKKVRDFIKEVKSQLSSAFPKNNLPSADIQPALRSGQG